MKKILLILFILYIGIINVDAITIVDSMPSSIGTVTQTVWLTYDNPYGTFSGTPVAGEDKSFFKYKHANGSIPTACADYTLPTPAGAGVTCTVSNTLTQTQRVALAKLLIDYPMNVTSSPTRTDYYNYYWAEIIAQVYITGASLSAASDPKVDTEISSMKSYALRINSFTSKVSTNTLSFSLSNGYYVSNVVNVSDPGGYTDFTYTVTPSSNAEIINKTATSFQVRIPQSKLSPGQTVTISANVVVNRPYHITSLYGCGDAYQRVLTPYLMKKTITGTGVTVSGTIKTSTELKLEKKDSNGKYIEDATMTLKYPDGSTKNYTSTTSQIKLTDVAYGKYCLTEISAPSGYIKFDGEECVTLDSNNGSKTITLINNLSEVVISKQDIVTSKELEGATLEILDKNKKSINLNEKIYKNVTSIIKLEKDEGLSWVSTNKENIIKGLPDGIYYLKETMPTNGYGLTEEGNYIKFEIKNGIVESGKIIMKNELSKITIQKIQSGTKKQLKGAKLTILDENKKEIDLEEEKYINTKFNNIELLSGKGIVWYSNGEDMTIEGLPIGKYYLVELIPPEGYEKEDEIEFEITIENNKSDLMVENDLIVEVPSTGQSNIIYIIIGSILLISGSLLIYFKRINKNV